MGPFGALSNAAHLYGLLQLGGQKGNWFGGDAGPTADLSKVLTGQHLPMQGLREAYERIKGGLRSAAERGGRADDGFRRRTALPGTAEWSAPPSTFADRFADWPMQDVAAWAGPPAAPEMSAARTQQETGSNANPFPQPVGTPQQGNPFPAPIGIPGMNANVGNMADPSMLPQAGLQARQVLDPATGQMMNDFYSKSFPPFFKPNIG